MKSALRSRTRREALRGLAALMAPSVLGATSAWAQTNDSDELPRIDDLPELLGQIRRTRIPLLLFFSTPGCPFCREVRGGYLAPRIREGAKDVVIREVDILSKRRLAGRAGQPQTEAELARHFGVRAVPVVLLVDADLKPLGKPLVGINASGFYEGLLSAAIDEATSVLRVR